MLTAGTMAYSCNTKLRYSELGLRKGVGARCKGPPYLGHLLRKRKKGSDSPTVGWRKRWMPPSSPPPLKPYLGNGGHRRGGDTSSSSTPAAAAAGYLSASPLCPPPHLGRRRQVRKRALPALLGPPTQPRYDSPVPRAAKKRARPLPPCTCGHSNGHVGQGSSGGEKMAARRLLGCWPQARPGQAGT